MVQIFRRDYIFHQVIGVACPVLFGECLGKLKHELLIGKIRSNTVAGMRS
jgi:hypothetical protein